MSFVQILLITACTAVAVPIILLLWCLVYSMLKDLLGDSDE